MNYRMANYFDIPQLLELRMLEQANDWKDQYPIDDELKARTKEAFEKMLNKTLFMIIAEDDGKIVATAAVIPHQYLPQADEHTGKRGYLCNVYTLKQYRRRGIQKELMKQIEEFSKNNLGIARLDLHASDGDAVYNMYTKLGWKFVNNNARKFLK